MSSILVAVDFSEPTDELVLHAENLAKCHNVPIHLVHVAAPDTDLSAYHPVAQSPEESWDESRTGQRERLAEFARQLRRKGLEAHATFTEGAAVKRILEIAHADSALVIVMGTHGHGLIYDALVGSVSEGVVRQTKVPVLLIPPASRRQP